MKTIDEIKKIANLTILEEYPGAGFYGMIYLPLGSKNHLFSIVVSWNNGWDHISIAHRYRDPEWLTMCKLKELFFDDDEVVVQYHPKKEDYINIHPHCLHLRKPQNEEVVHPPKELVI